MTTCPILTLIHDYWCTSTGDPAPATPTASAQPAPSAADVARVAMASLPLEVPQPHTSPPEDQFQLTPVVTWMYVDEAEWRATSATASIGDLSATVTATPESMKWDMGDGSAPVVCNGPGKPWTKGGGSPPCGYAYTTAGRYTITVEVTWRATWTSNTGEAGREADIVLSTTMPIWVRSAQAVTD